MAEESEAEVAAAIAAMLSNVIKVPSKRTAMRYALANALDTVPSRAIDAVTRYTLEKVPRIKRSVGTLEQEASRENLLLRAFYAINAARRLEGSEDTRAAAKAERSHFEAHREASLKRLAVARQVEGEAEKYGPVLGWHGIRDEHTDATCLERIGTNFDVRTPPTRLPGAVHPHCRCYAGEAFGQGLGQE